jgi:hypothetical protein
MVEVRLKAYSLVLSSYNFQRENHSTFFNAGAWQRPQTANEPTQHLGSSHDHALRLRIETIEGTGNIQVRLAHINRPSNPSHAPRSMVFCLKISPRLDLT